MAEPIRTAMIACCGNVEVGDDGFGPAVGVALAQWNIPAIEVIDLGTAPSHLLDVLASCQALCVVDAAMDADCPAGQLIDTDWFSPCRPTLIHERPSGTHSLTLVDQIALAHRLHLLPRHVRLVAATIATPRPGQPMCAALRELVPTAAERIVRWVFSVCDAAVNVRGAMVV